MSNHRKINAKTAFGVLATAYLLILTFHIRASEANGNRTSHFLVRAAAIDTVPAITKKDTVKTATKDSTRADSLKKKDSLVARTDTIRISKDSIDAIIRSHADDSAVLMVAKKEFTLYGKAKTNYKDLELEAATINFDQETKLVKAYGALDSTGNPNSKPQFTQGDMKTVSDSIIYNMNNNKGLTKNTFLQEGEIFVNAAYLKKVSPNEVFAQYARFTTCNLDTPHFAFRTRRMKMVDKKLAVTGRIYPEIESVPIPIISLPFAIFPLNPARHSGILPPSFTTSEDFGIGLEGLGYYKVINDNIDVTTRANIYSYGGWNLNVNSKYIQRYKLMGNLSLSFINSRVLNRNIATEEEYNSTRSFMINWSHSRDSRARPGTSFSANVNFGSTSFNQLLLNNPYQNYQNQLSSSVNYTKDWGGKYNLSLNLNHNQNSVSRLVNMNLPTMNFNVVTFYPFQKKESVGTGKWYEKIGIGYSGNFLNQLSFYDTAFNFRKMLDTLQYGAIHSIPITLSLPSLGPITVAPSISYDERWYGQKILRRWDSANQKVDTILQKGLYTARQMSFGVGINTRIFGTYEFPHSKRIIAIRHEMRPSFSLSYHPDFAGKYFYNTQVDKAGNKLRFSQFDGGIVGAFSEGAFGGFSFGIDNLLEMKVRDTKDSTDKKATKKIKLLDGFGFSSSYNLLADSFALGNFSLYARSTLFDKLNITASANIDPYDADLRGVRVNKMVFDPTHLKFGRVTGGSLAFSTSFSSKSKKGTADKDKNIPVDPFMTPDEQQRQLQFVRSNPAEFTDFDIPWNLSLSYSLNFSRVLKSNLTGYETQIFSSAFFNGDFSLSDKWKAGGTGYYDITSGSIQQVSMFLTREMHCWQLSITINPVGLYRSFSITINPKSGILRDLKINRSRTFSNY